MRRNIYLVAVIVKTNFDLMPARTLCQHGDAISQDRSIGRTSPAATRLPIRSGACPRQAARLNFAIATEGGLRDFAGRWNASCIALCNSWHWGSYSARHLPRPPPMSSTGARPSLVVANATGGGYGLYARLLARHMGRHIPGRPA